MSNMHLVTGYAGQEHIRAIDQGAFNAALIGTGQFVLDKGNVFEAQVISNNQVRILDGELMMQGRFVRLDPDNYVDLTIENGAQGVKRNDLIVVRYTKNSITGVEECNLVVIKGTAVASNPVDPGFAEGDITDGVAALHEFPLWRIPIDSLNVGTPESMFGEPFVDSMRTLPEIRNMVNQIHGEVDKQLAKQDAEIDDKIAKLVSYTKEETLTNNTKTMFNLGANAVPDDAFVAVKGLIDNNALDIANGVKIATGSYTGTGTAGEDNPNSLTFGFVPKLVIVSLSGRNGVTNSSDTPFIWVAPDSVQFFSSAMASTGPTCSVSGTTFSWYASKAAGQCNSSSETYNYFAIG